MVTPSYDAKCAALNTLYELMDVCQTCVFVNRRETADRLHAWLVQQGHKVGVIRGGDMDQKERMKVLKSFRNGETKVLITTDLLARGIDVLDVSLVINFDIPMRDNRVVGKGRCIDRRIARHSSTDPEERDEWVGVESQ